MPPSPANGDGPRSRTYSIAEAAQLAGLTIKAMKGRVDRSRANPESPQAIRYVMRDGRRRIPHAELERLGLISPGAAPGDDAPARRAADVAGPRAGDGPSVVVDVNALVTRVEQLAGDLQRARLLTEQAESGRTETVRELHEARAAARQAAAEAASERARAERAERERDEARRLAAARDAGDPRPAAGEPGGPEPEPGSGGLWGWLRRLGE